MRILFDSREIPAPERLEAWRSAVATSLIPTEVESPQPAAFTSRMNALSLGPVQIASLSYSALVARRSPRMIRQSDPECYQVALVRAGRQGIDQQPASTVLGPGELVVYDSSRPFEAIVANGASASETVVLQVPRRLLPLPARQVDRHCAAAIPGISGMGRLLAQFLSTMADEHDHYTSRDAVRLGAIALDLTTAVLAQRLESGCPPLRSPARLHYLRVVSFIERNLLWPDLEPYVIAGAHGISVRYLHRIFQQYHHTSVTSHIRNERLDRARRQLTDPAFDHLTIASIAARSGFDRPADFTRAFRRHVGVSPRDYRAQA